MCSRVTHTMKGSAGQFFKMEDFAKLPRNNMLYYEKLKHSIYAYLSNTLHVHTVLELIVSSGEGFHHVILMSVSLTLLQKVVVCCLLVPLKKY